MEDNSDVDSDGSDIDIGNFDENYDANDDFELPRVRVYNYVKNYDCSSIQDKMGHYDCSRIQDKMG
jgi:hypothetical protein